MTIGERIAEKRKSLGLSQEALGEKLGVSRQAIYKWEADQSLPEVDKLIGLSRLYNVSVGWLLGEEQEDSNEGTPEFSEEQIHLIEELLHKNQSQKEAPKKMYWWLGAAVLLVLVTVIILLFSKLSVLQKEYDRLENSIDNIYYDTQSQVNSVTDRVQEIIESANSLTSFSEVEIASHDYSTNTISFKATAKPKTFTEGMTAFYTIDNGENKIEVPADLLEDGSFETMLTCTLTDEITVWVTFVLGDVSNNQIVQVFYDLWCMSFPTYDPYSTLMGEIENNRFIDDVALCSNIYVSNSNEEENLPVAEASEFRMGLFADNELVVWYTKMDGKPNNWRGDFSDMVFFERPDVEFDTSKTYCEVVVITDKYGREIVWSGVPVYYDAELGWTHPEYIGNTNNPSGWKY